MYTLILQNERISTYNKIGLFILLISGAYGAYAYWNLHEGNFIALAIIAVVAGGGGLLNMGSFNSNKDPRIPFFALFIALAALTAWAGNYWFAIAYIAFIFLDITARQKQELIINESGIEMNFFPKRKIEWSELSNVVLKDGMLTIDFKNNRLMQVMLAKESEGVSEVEVNEWCGERVRGE